MGYYDYFLRTGPDGGEPVLWLLLEYCALGSVLDVMEAQGAALTEPQAAFVLREVRRWGRRSANLGQERGRGGAGSRQGCHVPSPASPSPPPPLA